LSHVGNTFLNAFQNVILLENAAQNPQNFPPAAVQNLISLNPYQNRLKSLIYRNHLKNLLIYRNHRPAPPPRGGGVQVLNECFGFNIVSVNKAYVATTRVEHKIDGRTQNVSAHGFCRKMFSKLSFLCLFSSE